MALDKATLIADLLAIFNNESAQETDPDQSRIRLANQMADAIEKYVKSGDGVYQVGRLTAGATVVTAVGSPAIKLQ